MNYVNNNTNVIDAIKSALDKIKGTYALVILSIDEQNKMYVTRHGSPCVIGFSDNKKLAMVASEIYGFNNNISKYIVIDNHDIITLDKIYEIIKMNSTEEKIYCNKQFNSVSEDQTC